MFSTKLKQNSYVASGPRSRFSSVPNLHPDSSVRVYQVSYFWSQDVCNVRFLFAKTSDILELSIPKLKRFELLKKKINLLRKDLGKALISTVNLLQYKEVKEDLTGERSSRREFPSLNKKSELLNPHAGCTPFLLSSYELHAVIV